MTGHGATISIPIWVRIPGILALVLVGVLLGALLLGAGSGAPGTAGWTTTETRPAATSHPATEAT